MATLAFTGFEDGVGSGLNGTASIGTTHVHSGSYALRVNPATTGTGFGLLSYTAASTAYLSVYVYFVSLPASGDEQLIAHRDSTNGHKLEVRINSAGKLAVYDTTHTNLLATGATVLSTGTWYLIGVRGGTGTTANWEITINGVSELSGTGSQGSSNGTNWVLGKWENVGGQGYEAWFDDGAVNDAAYPGVQQTLALVPNGTGTYQTATVGAGSGHWQAVSEIPNDGNTSYLVTDGTSGDAETEAMTDTAGAGIAGTVNGVQILEYHQRDGATNGSIKRRVRSGSTNSDSSATATVTGGYISGNTYLMTDPATSAAWTLSAVDAVECGVVENSANKTRITAIYLMVNFTNTGSSVSDADTAAVTDAGAAPPATFTVDEPVSVTSTNTLAETSSTTDTTSISESASVDTGSSASKSSADTAAFSDTGSSTAAFSASDTAPVVSTNSVNTGGNTKPPTTWQINSGHALANGLAFCVLMNEGAGATALTDYVSGVTSVVDSNLVWATMVSQPGVNLSGPYVDNINVATRATSKFLQAGACMADALYGGAYAGGFTTAYIFLPAESSTQPIVYVCDNSGQSPPNPGSGAPAIFAHYINYSPGPTPGTMGETLRNSSGNQISGANNEFPYDAAAPPWVFVVRVMGSGVSGGMKVYANLDTNGDAIDHLRLVSTTAAADSAGQVTANPIYGQNPLGVWGTLGATGGKAGYAYAAQWNRPLSVTVDGSGNVTGGELKTLADNPVAFMEAPSGTSPTNDDARTVTEAASLAVALSAPDTVGVASSEGVNTGATTPSNSTTIPVAEAAIAPPATLPAADATSIAEGQTVVSSQVAGAIMPHRFTGSTWRHILVAPTSLAVTPVSTTRLDLAWSLPAGSMNPKSVRVEESSDGGTVWTEIATLAPGTTAYSRTGLTTGQTRKYRVRETNNNGPGPYSNIGTGTTI